ALSGTLIARSSPFVFARGECVYHQSPMTSYVLWRRLQRLFKVNLCIVGVAEGQVVDPQILQGLNKFGIQRQDLLELLIRLLWTSGGGEGDPHQVASFEVVR